MEPSEGVTWLMQMSREMSLEAQHWELFANTWKAIGFEFDENLERRVRAHGKMLSLFLSDVKRQLVPKGTKISSSDLTQWTQKFERLQRTHGQLIVLFRRESEKFVRETGDGAAAWSPVGDD